MRFQHPARKVAKTVKKPATRRSRVTFDTVRRIALALPDVEESTTYGGAAFRVRGRMFVCEPTHRSAEPGSLVVLVGFNRRDELLAAEPETYYTKEHYQNYPSILVRLARIHPDALRDLIGMAHGFISAKGKARPPRRRRSRD
jgi:hypothetical protein